MTTESSSGFISMPEMITVKYENITPIANTRQSSLFRAKHHGRWVVLKALPKGSEGDVALTLKLEKEFAKYCEMNHANIVTAYAMEDVEGVGVVSYWSILTERHSTSFCANIGPRKTDCGSRYRFCRLWRISMQSRLCIET